MMEELKEKLFEEKQEDVVGFQRHKAAFTDIVSNQR